MTETPRRTVTLNPDELDLAEQLALSIALRTHPVALVVHGGKPDMETTARIMNQGWQSAHAWNAADDETVARDDAAEIVDEAAENGPKPVLFEHYGEVVAAMLLAPGWSFPFDAIAIDGPTGVLYTLRVQR